MTSDVTTAVAWRYLIATTAILIATLGPLLIALFYFANQFGAASSPVELAKLQAKRPETIILPIDLRYNGAFKLERIEQDQPEIICFSSSRGGGFEASMFEPYRFYNMSFTVWTTGQLADVFERTTRTIRPRVAIVSLDYFMFTNDWERSYSGVRDMMFGFDLPLRYIRSTLGDFVRTAWKHPDAFKAYLRSPNEFIGTQSILNQEGFRFDGSYHYSPAHVASSRIHYQNAEFLVNAMPGASRMSPRQKVHVERLARIAKERGIKLVAVQLPFIRAGVDYLDHNQSYAYFAGVWREFGSEETRAWLTEQGISFFDLARSPINDDRDNFIDAYHASHLGMLNVMQELSKSPEFRASFPRLSPRPG